jgi:16S rRNA (guanine966-N2)-methyltransferase
MRIIAGTLGGRIFDSPGGHRTHPMASKNIGALFNALGDVHGLTVLDAFAGSGALSFEAISRGASNVVAIDIDKEAYETIVANVAKLGIETGIMVLRKNVGGWTRNNQHKTFDLVLADPPYNDIRPDLLQKLSQQTKPGGLFVVSWPSSEPIRPFEGVEHIDTKRFGNAQLVFYRKTQ